MKKNTKMFQRSLTAFLTAALVTTSFGGQGIVFAKAKKKASHSVSLTVTNPAISMLSLKKGETFQLKVKVTPKKKAKKITVRSTKSSIVSVNKKGKCKAKKAGKAKVIVSCGKKKTVISVTVTKKLKKVKKVTLSKKKCQFILWQFAEINSKTDTGKSNKKRCCLPFIKIISCIGKQKRSCYGEEERYRCDYCLCKGWTRGEGSV